MILGLQRIYQPQRTHSHECDQMVFFSWVYSLVRKRRYLDSFFVSILTLDYFTGYCKVDQTEKGLFMQYIDRNPVVLKRQKELEKWEKEKEMMKSVEQSGCLLIF